MDMIQMPDGSWKVVLAGALLGGSKAATASSSSSAASSSTAVPAAAPAACGAAPVAANWAATAVAPMAPTVAPAVVTAASASASAAPTVAASGEAALGCLAGAPAALVTAAPASTVAAAAVPIDKCFREAGEWLVVEDEGVPWSCRLKQGSSQACVLQLLRTSGAEAGSSFCVWVRWGPPAAEGKHEALRFPSLESAKEAFKAKFHEKTNNQWERRHSFRVFFGKFVLAEPLPTQGTGAGPPAAPAEKLKAAHELIDLAKANKWADVFKALDRCRDLANVRPPVREYAVLHQAAFYGKVDVVKALIETYGADPRQVTKSGKSAADVAKERGHHELAASVAARIAKVVDAGTI